VYITNAWVFDFFKSIFYYILLCEYRGKTSLKNIFGWFKKFKTKLKKKKKLSRIWIIENNPYMFLKNNKIYYKFLWHQKKKKKKQKKSPIFIKIRKTISSSPDLANFYFSSSIAFFYCCFPSLQALHLHDISMTRERAVKLRKPGSRAPKQLHSATCQKVRVPHEGYPASSPQKILHPPIICGANARIARPS
jgi:hypothetical protein